MHFGQVQDLRTIDFALPADHPRTAPLLASLPAPVGAAAEAGAQIHIGCAQWGGASMVGKFYPSGSKANSFLGHYSRQLNTVELNSSFYATPGAPAVERWREMVPRGFRFSPKVPGAISHRAQLVGAEDLTYGFCRNVALFGDCLGRAFLQLPPHFRSGKERELVNYVYSFPDSIPLAVELRSGTWFRERTVFDRLHDVFEERGVVSVLTDVAGRRDVLHQRLTTGTAFIRFTGNAPHVSDYTRLDAWVRRLGHWLQAGLRELYFYIHQTRTIDAVISVAYMADRMNQELNTGLALPALRDVKLPATGRS